MSPIALFDKWYNQEKRFTKVTIPSACCLSTIGIDGFPNARFVSLKEIYDNKFVVTGPTTSRKGMEIDSNDKVALTFWWTETERQVRIQGNAQKISEELADKYFQERSRESQIVAIASKQGQELHNVHDLQQKYDEIEDKFQDQPLSKPKNWGGYFVSPVRMEFLEFKASRFHYRQLYELNELQQWSLKQLQP